MRKLIVALLTLIATAMLALATAPAAMAATPSDKPVVTIGALSVRSSGGVSPDTWHTDVTLPVGGFNYTPGGSVYVQVQNLTAGEQPRSGKWITAGTGPCGLECNNFGKISTTLAYSSGYQEVCNDTLRVWAWDATKSPQAGYGWSTRDVLVRC